MIAFIPTCRPVRGKEPLDPALSSGDTLGRENLGSRKDNAARQAIRTGGAERLFPPSYGPDRNPLE